MTLSKKDDDERNRASLRLYGDTSHITTTTTMNADRTLKGNRRGLRYTGSLHADQNNLIEIKTRFDDKDYNMVLVHNTLIEKKFYIYAKQMRKIMHPYDGRDVQKIPEIAVSKHIPNEAVCFKIKDSIGDDSPALWFVVAPVVNKVLTQDILEQVRRVAE